MKILVVVSHTDDEALGLGGTIASHYENGDEIYAISMTNGIDSRQVKSSDLEEERFTSSIKSSETLGFTWLKPCFFPDNAMDSVPLIEIVKKIEEAKNLTDPNIIYTHSSSDLNIDHRRVCEATLTAFRPQPDEQWNEIRTFEVPSATDYGHNSVTGSFKPNLFNNIESTIYKKIEALKAYSQEIRDYPHSRSFEGIMNLAKYRGNQVGLKYAEAFEVLKKIIR